MKIFLFSTLFVLITAFMQQNQALYGIYYQNDTKSFFLQMKTSSYVFHVTQEGLLEHLYWGNKIHQDENIVALNWDAEVVSFDAGVKNSKLLEYSDYGTGDYRIPALRIQYQDDGSSISPLVYDSFQILSGKPQSEEFIPHLRSDQQTQTLVIVLKDHLKNLKVHLYYSIYPESDIFTRSVEIFNFNKETVLVKELSSVQVDFPALPDYHMTQLSGSWGRERMVVTRPVSFGLNGIESRRGISSHQQQPFIILSEDKLNDDFGQHYVIGFIYASSFKGTFEKTQSETLRLTMGIHPDTFQWNLRPETSFHSPEAILGFSGNGMNQLSQELHDIIRKRVLPNEKQTQWTSLTSRPVLANSWEAMYFNCSEQNFQEKIVLPAKQLGIELAVLDDGWFGSRFDDKRALGDWQVNREKFPNGLDGLQYKVEQKGLLFGIWMEPEMINKDSQLYREHPDWCLHLPGRERTESRNQLVLDLSREEVQLFIISSVSRILRESKASYLKWDFNRPLTEIGNEILPKEQQGELLHRWTIGLYKILHQLTSQFPNVLFESCSGGGGRFDLALLYFSTQYWTSDNTDAVERTRIQWGTNFIYPPNAMASHVSAVPNHQLHRTTSLKTRHLIAMNGILGYELNLAELSQWEQEQVRAYIQFYKKNIESLVLSGKLYRISSPFINEQTSPHVASWMYVSPDQSKAFATCILMSYYQVILRPPHLKMKGLDPNSKYKIYQTTQDESFQLQDLGVKLGSTLMNAGLVIKLLHDADSVMIYMEKV